MLSISRLLLPNVGRYWVNICKEICKSAMHCAANYERYLPKKARQCRNFYKYAVSKGTRFDTIHAIRFGRQFNGVRKRLISRILNC